MKSAYPTRKWVAAQVVALAAVAVMWVNDTAWHDEQTIALIGWFVQAATTYLVPNEPTPGGVPVKRSGVAGYGLLEVVVALLVILILVFVLLRVA